MTGTPSRQGGLITFEGFVVNVKYAAHAPFSAAVSRIRFDRLYWLRISGIDVCRAHVFLFCSRFHHVIMHPMVGSS